MQFLVKRETSLADALEALTTVMLHVLSAKYGKRDEFFRSFEQVSRFLGSTERDLALERNVHARRTEQTGHPGIHANFQE
jgi:hypothetical protein